MMMTRPDSKKAPSTSVLSLNEKISLLSGIDFWRTKSLPEHGIPSIKLSDGPNGVRGDLVRSVPATSFPVGACLGASWNSALVSEIGRAIAVEAKEKGAHVVLGPTINLQRTPIGGRNFECYSEDPYLTGMLGTAFVESLQAEGIGACPKHFVANDTEFERHTINSVVPPDTLRSTYLLPFEMVVKKTQPWMIMSSYNRVNGVYASSHTDLLISTLKQEWGFEGVVVSDWGAALETIPNALGGLDLEMPGPSKVWGTKLHAAVENGEVSETCIDEKVSRLFRLIERTGAHIDDAAKTERGEDAPWKRELVRRAATEGMVLLKNEDAVLPLDPDFAGTLAVIGPNAARGQIMGGGSSSLTSHSPIHPLDGIRRAFPKATVEYAQGCRNNKYAPLIDPARITAPSGGTNGFEQRTYTTSRFDTPPLRVGSLPSSLMKLLDAFGTEGSAPGGIILEGDYTPEFSGAHTVGLMSAGRARLFINDEEVIDNWTDWKRGHSFYTFGSDEVRAPYTFDAAEAYRIRVEYERPPAALIAGVQFGIERHLSDTAIAEAAALAARSDATILILGSNPDWETEGHDRVIHGLPGLQDELAEAVLTASPDAIIVMNVGSATEMRWYDKAKAVLVTWFGGQEMGNALGDVLSGQSDPGGRLPFTWPVSVKDHPAMQSYPGKNGHLHYTEGPYIGYRGFLAQEIVPLAPFGFGLSYGDAQIGEVTLVKRESDTTWKMLIEIRNLSRRPATSVVQAYAKVDQGPENPPLQLLIGFTKYALQAQENRKIELSIDTMPIARLSADTRYTQLPWNICVGISASGPFIEIAQPD